WVQHTTRAWNAPSLMLPVGACRCGRTSFGASLAVGLPWTTTPLTGRSGAKTVWCWCETTWRSYEIMLQRYSSRSSAQLRTLLCRSEQDQIAVSVSLQALSRSSGALAKLAPAHARQLDAVAQAKLRRAKDAATRIAAAKATRKLRAAASWGSRVRAAKPPLRRI